MPSSVFDAVRSYVYHKITDYVRWICTDCRPRLDYSPAKEGRPLSFVPNLINGSLENMKVKARTWRRKSATN